MLYNCQPRGALSSLNNAAHNQSVRKSVKELFTETLMNQDKTRRDSTEGNLVGCNQSTSDNIFLSVIEALSL